MILFYTVARTLSCLEAKPQQIASKCVSFFPRLTSLLRAVPPRAVNLLLLLLLEQNTMLWLLEQALQCLLLHFFQCTGSNQWGEGLKSSKALPLHAVACASVTCPGPHLPIRAPATQSIIIPPPLQASPGSPLLTQWHSPSFSSRFLFPMLPSGAPPLPVCVFHYFWVK